MNIVKPKWLAIGKQTGKYQTRSQILPNSRGTMNSRIQQSENKDLLKNYSVTYFSKSQQKQQNRPQQQCESVQYQQREQFYNYNSEQIDSFNNNNLQNIKRKNHMNLKQVDQFSPLYATDYYNSKQLHQYTMNGQLNNLNQKIHDSIVLEQHNIINKQKSSNDSFGFNPNVINIDTSQSEILQAVSFASQNQRNTKTAYNNKQGNNNNTISQNMILTQKFQSRSKTIIIRDKLHHLQQMLDELKTVQQTIKTQIIMCRQHGKYPLFYGNKQFEQFMVNQIQYLFFHINNNYNQNSNKNNNQQIISNNNFNNDSSILSKQFNNSFEHEVLDSSFRQLNNGKMIQRMVGSLQQKQKLILILQTKLNQKQQEINQKQSILISKLELINQLHEEISKYKEKQNSQSRNTSQHTSSFSPQIQKLLREKEIKNLQLSHEIQLIKQKNQYLNNEKQSLQQQIFTLEQKIIGVQMQVQQRVRKGIQDISFAIEKKIKQQLSYKQKQSDVNNKNQCYLQTIDTLSKEITDLTEKCKSYERYIREQETSEKSNNLSQYEDFIKKKNLELEAKENHLANIQKQLSFKQKKLKDVQIRNNRQSSQIQKQNIALQIKAQQIQKYQQQLNSKQQDLYNWQKSLTEQEKLLNRKSNQIQRQKAIYEEQLNTNIIMSPYNGPEIRTVIVPPYPNAYSAVNPRINHYNQNQVLVGHENYYQQPKVHYDRSMYQQNSMPNNQQFYQPSYGQQNNPNEQIYQANGFRGNKTRQSRQSNTDQSIQEPHVHYPSNLKGARSHAFNHQNTQFNSSYQQQNSQKIKSGSMKIKPGSAMNHDYQKNLLQQSKNNRSKFYLSTAYDKKQLAVEEILSKRRNQAQNIKSFKTGKNHLNQLFGKSQLRAIKSPTNQNTTISYGKQTMQHRLRQHRQKFQSRKVYQKPSKDFNQLHRVSPVLFSNNIDARRSAYDINKDNSGLAMTDKSYNSKMFTKSSIPGATTINQKLQKLKQQIKRQVKNLD